MGGATWSHIQIAGKADDLHATKVDVGMADLVLACDSVVGASKPTLTMMLPGRTYVVLNSHATPTAAFVRNPDWQPQADRESAAIAEAVGPGQLGSFDADRLATRELGQSIYSNLLLLGYAWQKGRVPLAHPALMRAIELNGVQVENNKAAFELGRRCAHDPAATLLRSGEAQIIKLVKKTPIEDVIRIRAEFLAGYQDGAYAGQYLEFISRVQMVEARLGSARLAEAVARNLFKLMAYKDEYEVARLHVDPVFTGKIAEMFEGNFRLVHHLAPPLFAKKNDRGELVKQQFGQWMRGAFHVLAKLKGLRGTPFDPFGYTAERREERALIAEYRRCIEELLQSLSQNNLTAALEIARLPEEIRGYGHVKARHLAQVRARWQTLMLKWRAGGTTEPEEQRSPVAAFA